MKYLLIFLIPLLFLLGCNTVSEEVMGPGTTPPDSLGFQTVTSSGITLEFKLDSDNLHCKLSAATSGWVAVGFNPSQQMKDANFIIGYVEGGNGFIRDDFGVSNTVHESDLSLGGSDDITLLSSSEAGGTTKLEFLMPLNSGDSYDRTMEVGQNYPLILAKGSSDDFTGYHSAVGMANINLSSEAIIQYPDLSNYISLDVSGINFRYSLTADSMHCYLKAETTGWIGLGLNPINQMEEANFLIGFVNSDGTQIRDDWGNSATSHVSDISLGGSSDIFNRLGKEEAGFTELYFSIPLISGDGYDQEIATGNNYPIILASGNEDNFDSIHSVIGAAVLDLGGGTVVVPDTTGYQHFTTNGFTFRWFVTPDSLHCAVETETEGWVAVGFDSEMQMLNSNFIIGYMNNGSLNIRDDFGSSATTHQSDLNLGGSSDLYNTIGFEDNGITKLLFSIPLNSGDIYDRVLVVDQNYPILFARGNEDDFTSYHTSTAVASFTISNNPGGNETAFTTGGDIILDNDTANFNTEIKDNFTFRWKVVGDSLRCMILAPTTGWVAVGFDPSDNMLDADFLIGYVNNGTAFVRDDFGISETSHSADLGLGGVNNVSRVFGHEENGFTELRFTIPLNSGDSYDRVLQEGIEYEIIFAYGYAGNDDFTSMHEDYEDIDIEL